MVDNPKMLESLKIIKTLEMKHNITQKFGIVFCTNALKCQSIWSSPEKFEANVWLRLPCWNIHQLLTNSIWKLGAVLLLGWQEKMDGNDTFQFSWSSLIGWKGWDLNSNFEPLLSTDIYKKKREI